ncbi:hypothetical protein B0T25DRAFT_550588 [Lasiosphaeria hispida]|uniref:Uncharacterized protein n=1 Tax=Lasiosphaeria hispida TaxID=260671 RepID=A0AAJ0HAB4_9PEZI|nr:hypothetical protein B0T25DRAFT_550588 [Lasiosphaeria hispida]
MHKLRSVIKRRSHRQIVPARAEVADDGASILSSQSIDSRLTQLPVALLTKFRVATLTRLPLETIAQLPPETIARLPIETLSQLPVETLVRLPIDTLARLPSETLTQLPPSVLSDLPLEVLEQLPPTTLAGLPVKTLAQLPLDSIIQLPPETIVQLPLETLLELPGESYARLRPDLLAQLEPFILASLLDRKPTIPRGHLLSKLAPPFLSAVICQDRRLLRYLRPELISELDAAVFADFTVEQCSKFLPMSLLQKPPPEFLEKLPESSRNGLLSSLRASVPSQRDRLATSPGAILAEVETLLLPYFKQPEEELLKLRGSPTSSRLAIEAREIVAATNALMGRWKLANEHGRAAVDEFYALAGRGSSPVLGAIALMVRICELAGDDDDAECWRDMLPANQEICSLLGVVKTNVVAGGYARDLL